MVKNIGLVLILVIMTLVRVLGNQPTVLRARDRVRIVDSVEAVKTFDKRSEFKVHGYYVKSSNVAITEGDRVEVVGVVRIDNAFTYIEANTAEVLAPEPRLFGMVRSTRTYVTDMVDVWLPHTEASVAKGIVWGEQKDLSKEIKQQFQLAGLSHLLVASGFNVSLLAISLEIFSARIFGKKSQIYFVILCTILYGFILRYSIPVLRATLLLIMLYLSKLLGRRTSGGYVLVITGLVLLVIEPSLARSVSFQLSFLATAGLVYAQNSAIAVINLFVKPVFVILFTLPILLFNFGSFNLLSIPANVLVEPFIPFLSEILIIAEIVGALINTFGMWLAWITLPILKFLLFISNFVAEQEWAVIQTRSVPIVGWGIYYLGLVLFLFYRERKSFR